MWYIDTVWPRFYTLLLFDFRTSNLLRFTHFCIIWPFFHQTWRKTSPKVRWHCSSRRGTITLKKRYSSISSPFKTEGISEHKRLWLFWYLNLNVRMFFGYCTIELARGLQVQWMTSGSPKQPTNEMSLVGFVATATSLDLGHCHFFTSFNEDGSCV